MPSKRQPSKQRRAAENRAKRQALAARSVHAQEPRPTASKAKTASGSARGSASSAGGGGLLGMLGLGGGGGGGGGSSSTQPGAKAMQMALFFVPVSILAVFVLPFVQVDDRGDALPTTGFKGLYLQAREILTGQTVETENVSVFSANGWASLPFMVLPALVVVGAFLAFRNKPAGRTLTIAMLVLAATVILGGGAFFLPSLVAIGIASFQVRKSEMVAQRQAAAEEAGAAAEEDEEYEDEEDAEYDEEDEYEDEDAEYDEEDEYEDEDAEYDEEDEYEDEDAEYEDGDIYDEEDEDAVTEDDAGKSPR